MPSIKITSFQNPHIKKIALLKKNRERRANDLTVVEGLREVGRAWKSGAVFQEVFVCREILPKYSDGAFVRELESHRVPVLEVAEGIFQKISFGDRQEGVLGVVRPVLFTFADLKWKKNPLLVVVEGLEKPGNLGAILRTCDAAGVTGLLICDGRTDIYNPHVIRSSIGTVFSVKSVSASNEAVLKFLRNQKIKICAACVDAKTVYSEADLTGPLAIVLGSEDQGLSDFWVKASDMKVKIPMSGRGDSLNVSVTAAVIVYEALRQRRGASC